MDTDRGHSAHIVRTLLLASVTIAIAAAAHLLGGGSLPTPGGLLVLGLLTTSGAALVGLSRTRLWLLLAYLATAQTLLHHGFVVASQDTAARAAAAHGTAPAAGTAHGGPHTPVTTGTGAELLDPMIGFHCVATLVTALLILGSERAWATTLHVWEAILPALTDRFRPVVCRLPRADGVVGAPDVTPRSVVVTTNDPRRGPPAPVAAG